jgi:galactose mutarotase-like enzyme
MGQTHILSNKKITIKVNEFGAELCALIKNDTQYNYLWDAKPEYWARYSPVLFPIVGKLKNNEYNYNEVTYSMKQHGFARDMEFELLSMKEDEIWHRLISNEITKKMYPFDFILDVGYKIEDTKVSVMWKVKNIGNDEMYFSIGAHPAFLCPLYDNEKQRDCSIDFHTNNTITYLLVDENGYVDENEQVLHVDNGLLKITDTLFDKDALIIENNQTQSISLVGPSNKAYLTVRFDAPLFGLWSPPKKNAPFICIEPWYGRSDASEYAGAFDKRKWSNTLKINETFEKSYMIELVE